MREALFLILAYTTIIAGMTCSDTSISCANGERCVPLKFLCDSGGDCGDNSDEDPDLCMVWSDTECRSGKFSCKVDGDSHCMNIERYCTDTDSPCEATLDWRICLMIASRKIVKLDNFGSRKLTKLDIFFPGNLNQSEILAEKFRNLIPYTLRHKRCPAMYTLVGDQCLSIFNVISMSWSESRVFCNLLEGDLMTFRNITQYAAIVKHLQNYGLTTNFWIGGRIENDTAGWTWIDGSPMEIGSPYWATKYSDTCVKKNLPTGEEICLRYRQAPEVKTKGQCASFSFEHFFYINDDDCVKRMSPLCVHLGQRINFQESFTLPYP